MGEVLAGREQEETGRLIIAFQQALGSPHGTSGGT